MGPSLEWLGWSWKGNVEDVVCFNTSTKTGKPTPQAHDCIPYSLETAALKMNLVIFAMIQTKWKQHSLH